MVKMCVCPVGIHMPDDQVSLGISGKTSERRGYLTLTLKEEGVSARTTLPKSHLLGVCLLFDRDSEKEKKGGGCTRPETHSLLGRQACMYEPI